MHLEEDILIFPCKNLEDEEDLYQINYQPYDGTGQKKTKAVKSTNQEKRNASNRFSMDSIS
jgi:hypothetical protein